MHIDKNIEIITDDDKWKIKLEEKGKRVITMQFEQRSASDYPVWKDAILGMKEKVKLMEEKALAKTTEAMDDAVQKGRPARATN